MESVLVDYSCCHVFQGTYVEGIKEEVVLSPGHALSFIAAGEGVLLTPMSFSPSSLKYIHTYIYMNQK